MGETAVSSRSVRRLHRLVEEQVKDPAKVVNAEDETEEAAERRASKRGQSVGSSKRKGKQAKEEVVTRELMGTDVVDAVSLELGLLKWNDDCNGNSRSSGIVLNAVPQEFVANMERSLARGDDAASASSSGEVDEDDSVMDLESAAEQGDTSMALSREDTTFLAGLTQVIQRGGDWKKLTITHMKAYLRHHRLFKSGSKNAVVNRVEQHLKIKDGQGEDIYPRSSFIIDCKGDICLGDTVLFLQTVYDSYDFVTQSASGPPLGERWVAGKVVHESYGAKKQQHSFTPWINKEDREQVLAKKQDGHPDVCKKCRGPYLHNKGGFKSRPSSRVPSKPQHPANLSWSMPMQSSIQQDSQQKVSSCNSSVAASSHLPPLLQNFVQQQREVAMQQQRGGEVFDSSLLPNTFQRQGICHVACSNSKCKKVGAKHCVSQLCAVCCYKNSSSRGSCPRHQ